MLGLEDEYALIGDPQVEIFCEWFGMDDLSLECFSRDKMDIFMSLVTLVLDKTTSLELIKEYVQFDSHSYMQILLKKGRLGSSKTSYRTHGKRY